MNVWIELAVVVGLIVLNGFFAMAEMAIVSSRRIRLQQMADAGSGAAAAALALTDNPSRFLSGVQVGITGISILSGAFGGATLGARLGDVLEAVPMFGGRGREVAVALVVIGITILSLIIGELLPKRIALTNPEGIARRVARPLQMLVTVARPVVWLLETTTAVMLKLLGIPEHRELITEEEVKLTIAEGAEAGAIDAVEQQMIHGVLGLADRPIASAMTPRPDVYWIDLDDDPQTLAREIVDCPFSRIVAVRDGDLGSPLGVILLKDLVADLVTGSKLDLAKHVREPIYVPESISVLRTLELFRSVPLHTAFVVDEYGDFLGIATIADVLEAVAGDLPQEHEDHREEIVQRPDGSWLVDGRTSIDALRAKLPRLPDTDGDFHTAAGLALERLARIPKEGETFELGPWHVEVVDMDGKRIDKLLFVQREAEPV